MNRTSLAVNKILYVSDTPDEDISARLPQLVESWEQAGLEEVISLQVSSSDTWRKNLAPRRIKSTIHIVDAIEEAQLFNLARQENVSLVVVDTVKRGAQRRAFVRRLTSRTDVPILVTNEHNDQASSQERPGVFDSVVIALDFTPAYDKALRFLFCFNKLIQALEIVNVVNAKLTIRDIHELKQELRVTRRLCTENGIDAEAHVYAGKTAEELIASAEDYKATLIVLGIGGKLTWFKRLFRRSTIYAITNQARVPILFVP